MEYHDTHITVLRKPPIDTLDTNSSRKPTIRGPATERRHGVPHQIPPSEMAAPFAEAQSGSHSDARSIRASQAFQSGPIPDDDYFHTENVYLQVSNRLFAIPKEHLDVPGSTFHDMFRDKSYNNSAQTSTGQEIVRGSHSTHPIILTGVTVDGFRSFLKVAWPKKNSSQQLSVQGWKDVLTLASGWKFDKIMNEAKKQVFQLLQSKDPFELIDLGRRFRYSEWVVHGYTLLARPSHMLSGKLLVIKGLGDKMSDIFMIREALRQLESRKSLPCMGCNTAPPCTPHDAFPCKHPSIAYCTCRQTVFLHPPYPPVAFDWAPAAEKLVREVFQIELAELDRNLKLTQVTDHI